MIKFYFSVLLIVLGIVALVQSIVIGLKLVRLGKNSRYLTKWKILLSLNIFFLAGYIVTLSGYLPEFKMLDPLFISVLYFMGGVFVYISVKTGYDTIHELKATLFSREEKEILLKELHHRVKNNLQVIISIMKLQQYKAANKETEHFISECQSRIFSMALIHETLYKSEDFSSVCFKNYCEHLVKGLVDSSNDELDKNICTRVRCQDIKLKIDKLVPLGLILNEFVVNSIKHAFPGTKDGQIEIEANRINECFLIRYSDNGIGFSPEKFHQPGDHSLGMELIHVLVEQIDGDLQLMQNDGTTYILKIPLN